MTAAPRKVAIGEKCNRELRDRLRIFVDGDLLRDVLAYDQDEGWIMCIMHGECGERLTRGGGWLCKIVIGDVKVGVV